MRRRRDCALTPSSISELASIIELKCRDMMVLPALSVLERFINGSNPISGAPSRRRVGDPSTRWRGIISSGFDCPELHLDHDDGQFAALI